MLNAESFSEKPSANHTALLNSPSPVPARLLAAFVDSLVFSALSWFIPSSILGSNSDFIVTFLIGSIYFSVGNSGLCNGATLGKKAFGLRVVTTNRTLATQTDRGPYLNLRTSFARFFYSIGILILFAEIPPTLYRELAFVASPYLLETHMLLALIYFATNVACVIRSPLHIGLHDSLVGAYVTRADAAPDITTNQTTRKSSNSLALNLLIGLSAAGCLWFWGLSDSELVHSLRRQHYALEHYFPVRIGNIQQTADKIVFSAIFLDHGGNREDASKATRRIAEYLKANDDIIASKLPLIEFVFQPETWQREDSVPWQFLVETETL